MCLPLLCPNPTTLGLSEQAPPQVAEKLMLGSCADEPVIFEHEYDILSSSGRSCDSACSLCISSSDLSDYFSNGYLSVPANVLPRRAPVWQRRVEILEHFSLDSDGLSVPIERKVWTRTCGDASLGNEVEVSHLPQLASSAFPPLFTQPARPQVASRTYEHAVATNPPDAEPPVKGRHHHHHGHHHAKHHHGGGQLPVASASPPEDPPEPTDAHHKHHLFHRHHRKPSRVQMKRVKTVTPTKRHIDIDAQLHAHEDKE